jgi:UDP-N-acetyl-D-mannosaminuronate dehydrogenase
MKEYDVAVLLTDHDDFPYDLISEYLPAIIDTRNGFAKADCNGRYIRVLGAGNPTGVHSAVEQSA